MVDDPDSELEAVTGELYRLDPGDFVSARNDLVRRLRKDGNRELAARVAELRRPTPAAWAVNRVARQRHDDLEVLVRLGEALRTAQTQTLAGVDADTLRQAGRARRDAVANLADIATAFLAERGAGAGAHQAEVVATLEAASLDPDAAVRILAGRLTSSLEPPWGFGDAAGFAGQADAEPPPRPTDSEPPSGETVDTGGPAADVAALIGEAERAGTEAGMRAADLAVNARDAAALVARRLRKVDEAEAEVARLEAALDEARAQVETARRDVDQARGAAEQADAAAAEATAAYREAGRRLEDLRSRASVG